MNETQKPVMAVGDLSSSAKGTGARANGGKPDYSLMSLLDLAGTLLWDRPDSLEVAAIRSLGHFQATHDPVYLRQALATIGYPFDDACRVFTYGAKKYAAWNWAKGMPWSVPLACAVRHLLASLRGEKLDPESGESHLGHVACNIQMLQLFGRTYPEGNDLPPKGLLG